MIEGVELAYPTDLGGYPLYYVMKDSSVVCPECVNGHLEEIAECMADQAEAEWIIEGVGINDEDEHLYCDRCNKRIEPAYSDD